MNKIPYIKQGNRPELDNHLQKLWEELNKGNPTLDEVKGKVNYCFTKILITLLKKYGTRYHTLSNIKAIAQDVVDEFGRQYMEPYEDEKIKENGKVQPLGHWKYREEKK